MTRRGDLFVISAPSGAGKTTLCRMLVQDFPDLRHSVSYTTRKMRPGEVDGVDYRFVSTGEFDAMRKRGEFLEWAEVHGNFYGTAGRGLKELVESGLDALLDIDVQGARQVKPRFPNAILVFILPPSRIALRERLTNRGSDSPDVIERRLRNSINEIKEYKMYDYVIINDILEEAHARLKAIVTARRASVSRIDPDWIKNEFLTEEAQG